MENQWRCNLEFLALGMEYLLSRGYTEELILKEGVRVIEDDRRVDFVCKSWSGKIAGIVKAWYKIEEEEYKSDGYRHEPMTKWFPTYYGTVGDHELMKEKRKVVLVEGVFDRIAVKRCFPDVPVIARLSLGLSKGLLRYCQRYVDEVCVMFDNDEPGKRASEAALKMLKKVGLVGWPIVVVSEDPSSRMKKVGLRKFRRELEGDMAMIGELV